jgi:GTP-binding protein
MSGSSDIAVEISDGFDIKGGMSQPKVRFLKSALNVEDFPEANRPEIALVGRSNSGKSSMLNAIAGTKTALVSQTPGKTRLLNFFDFGQHYRFVDMPGYGFAARAQDEIDKWQETITTYFEERKNLKGIVLIMDARREWQDEEEWIKRWGNKLGLEIILVLNKADKFNKSEQAKIAKAMTASQPTLKIHLVSAEKKTGVDGLEKDIFDRFVRGVKN